MVKQPKSNLLSAIFHGPIYLLVILGTLAFLIIITPLIIHFTVIYANAHTRMNTVASCEKQPAIKVMPLGDSITFGEGSTAFGGYRVALWDEACSAHLHIIFVGSRDSGPATLPSQANEGHPGWRIDQISTQVVAWLHHYQPRVILLHIGTNDLLRNYRVSTAPARLQHLLTQITTTLPHAIVIVAQIIPMGKPGLSSKVVAYNSAIPAIVHNFTAQGKQIEYVDMYHAVPLSDIPDQKHPNNQGYSLMASVWFAALKSALQSHTTLTSALQSHTTLLPIW